MKPCGAYDIFIPMSSTKPSKPEHEYFTRVEFEKKRKLAEQYEQALNEEEKARLKELHWKHCPRCGLELQEVVYHGVTVEKCFNCDGIFIGSQDLEKIAGKEDGFMPGLMSLFKT